MEPTANRLWPAEMQTAKSVAENTRNSCFIGDFFFFFFTYRSHSAGVCFSHHTGNKNQGTPLKAFTPRSQRESTAEVHINNKVSWLRACSIRPLFPRKCFPPPSNYSGNWNACFCPWKLGWKWLENYLQQHQPGTVKPPLMQPAGLSIKLRPAAVKAVWF